MFYVKFVGNDTLQVLYIKITDNFNKNILWGSSHFIENYLNTYKYSNLEKLSYW